MTHSEYLKKNSLRTNDARIDVSLKDNSKLMALDNLELRFYYLVDNRWQELAAPHHIHNTEIKLAKEQFIKNYGRR